jgi:ribose transport system permease protein
LILVGVDPAIQLSVQGVVIVAAIAATAWTQRHRLRVIK